MYRLQNLAHLGASIPRNLFHLLALLTGLAGFSAGCSRGSSGVPSESSGRTVLEHRVERQSKGAVRVVSFTKVNAVAQGNLYRMEFQAEIEFQNDGTWTKGGKLDSHVFYNFSPGTTVSGGGFGAQVEADLTGNENVRKGERRTVKDALDFEKTEKGWKAEDDQLY